MNKNSQAQKSTVERESASSSSSRKSSFSSPHSQPNGSSFLDNGNRLQNVYQNTTTQQINEPQHHHHLSVPQTNEISPYSPDITYVNETQGRGGAGEHLSPTGTLTSEEASSLSHYDSKLPLLNFIHN